MTAFRLLPAHNASPTMFTPADRPISAHRLKAAYPRYEDLVPEGFERAAAIAGAASHAVLAAEAMGEIVVWRAAWQAELDLRGADPLFAAGDTVESVEAAHLRMLASLPRPWLTPGYTVIGAELVFVCRLLGRWFCGIADLVLVGPDGKCLILDYKFGVERPEPGLDPAAHLYPLAGLCGHWTRRALRLARGGWDWSACTDWFRLPGAARGRPAMSYVWLGAMQCGFPAPQWMPVHLPPANTSRRYLEILTTEIERTEGPLGNDETVSDLFDVDGLFETDGLFGDDDDDDDAEE